VSVNIALIGLGYWGPNLARCLNSLGNGTLQTICDLRRERLDQFVAQYPKVHMTMSYQSVLEDQEVDAVVISTPAQTHFELTKHALLADKHVLVEKPLAQTVIQCKELIELATARRRVLMSGHVFVYNPAVQKVKGYIESGLLGHIHYVYSQRLNLGIIRQDINALWNFAPHDLSILNYWLGSGPLHVTARGYDYIQPGIEDVVFMTLDYPHNVGANVHISWLDPLKVRRMTIVGSEKMVVYDDVSADARITIYDKGISKRPSAGNSGNGQSASLGEFATFGEFQLLLRAGDVIIPKLDFAEPLKLECQHFVHCVLNDEKPLTSGYEGLQVVKALEAAQSSLAQKGKSISVQDE
jgi:predicted dehydrogenase